FDPGGEQASGGLHPVHPRHADIHQDDIGSQFAGAFDRLRAVACLADDLEIGLGVQEQPEADPNELLVVDDQEPDAHASPPTGRRAATRKPPPARGPTSSCPPSRVMRSCNPMMPCPACAVWDGWVAPSSTTSISRQEAR